MLRQAKIAVYHSHARLTAQGHTAVSGELLYSRYKQRMLLHVTVNILCQKRHYRNKQALLRVRQMDQSSTNSSQDGMQIWLNEATAPTPARPYREEHKRQAACCPPSYQTVRLPTEAQSTRNAYSRRSCAFAPVESTALQTINVRTRLIQTHQKKICKHRHICRTFLGICPQEEEPYTFISICPVNGWGINHSLSRNIRLILDVM